ncbi:trans-sulfuration enzyme family protein [Calorimonas adulescens]|jgi:cystathionine gamma-lyase (EC 4.4.1.1)|uniref:Aminotransferase class I/II-fold pyridoxal phosphate-dependent enzyme n=1 Tax=Calorimonas adulescens TaxID=2606906 RepID=A0A5D8QD32_9THEO|nr:aminotransferase class I/II-fold pyridoxal phosphate-dependent enzyme [Calorimonas adulescens]TZE82442.1 aminotransferase class I/II-fold pyridoxal phosphate-dependent enzyme [Calorimonas adulescens]
MGINTRLIHGGISWDKQTGAVNIPIYQTSTFKQKSLGETYGYEYSRTGNPTREALESLIAELEGGLAGFAFSSGMAAISSVFMLFNSGDKIVLPDNIYGGTYRVMENVFKRFGLRAVYIDTTKIEEVEKAFEGKARAIFIETPTNPLMDVTDIRRVAEVAKRAGGLTIVDNTFMTPYLQRPIELGADIVVHSATKYLGGHSDVVAGLAVTATEELKERLHFIQNSVGAVLGPQDSYYIIRGVKTLGVRMDRHEENAMKVAKWLRTQEGIEKVYYPGLPDHPGHKIMKGQADGFGGILSFRTSTPQLALKILNGVRLITLGESLGGVESLICQPATMTHASFPEDIRGRLGIDDCLVRLSVGIEDADDIIEDLRTAMGG